MDPITAAILAALAAGAGAGVTKLGESIVGDSYAALKSLIQRKFGNDSGVAKAVDEVENNRESEGRKQVLKEEIKASNADKDDELVALARALIGKIGDQPGGKQIVVNVTGDRSVGIGGDSNSNTIITGNR